MRRIMISARRCDEMFVRALLTMMEKGPVAVEVEGGVPKDSPYGLCVQEGSLYRLAPDERAFRPGAKALEARVHVWEQGGLLRYS